MTILNLRRGPTKCEVAPEIGGAILSLTVSGIPVLRTTPPGNKNVLDTACFPLVPFANRIDEGRFVFRGREIVLPQDPAAPPHAHHGHGWRRRWTIDRSGDDYADLSLVHERGDWPWRYRTTQNLTATANGLDVVLMLYNLDDTPMPAGLGLHPFFPHTQDTQLVLGASECLLNDERGIPKTKVAFKSGVHALAALENTDNLLLGGDGWVKITGSTGTTRIITSGAIGFHLYVPSEQPFFCAEPVTHPPDSFRAERSNEVLEPGAAMALLMTINYTADG